MRVELTTRDSRLVARLLNLAHRFGCSYRECATSLKDDEAFTGFIDFTGPPDALRRLRGQINKLIATDKEYAQ